MSLKHSRFDAAIVDLDGTLVDTLGDFVVALNRMLADLSLSPVDRSVVETRVGKGSEHLIRFVRAEKTRPSAAAQDLQGAGKRARADLDDW